MTPMDCLRFTGVNGPANPDLFLSVESSPAGLLQCGDRDHPTENCHSKPCVLGTIFSFGTQVCTRNDVGIIN